MAETQATDASFEPLLQKGLGQTPLGLVAEEGARLQPPTPAVTSEAWLRKTLWHASVDLLAQVDLETYTLASCAEFAIQDLGRRLTMIPGMASLSAGEKIKEFISDANVFILRLKTGMA